MPNFFTERVGGVEIQTYLIAKYLAALTWNVDFIAETGRVDKIGTFEIIDGINVHWIRKRGMFSFFRRDVHQLLKRIRPQILYQRGRNKFTSAPTIPRNHTGIRTIYHCAENNDLNLHFSFREVLQSRKNTVKKTILFVHALLSDYFFRQTIRRSHRIIVQTGRQAEGFKNIFSLDSRQMPSSHEIPAEPLIKETPPVVLWIAHAGRRKRAELFIELAKRFQFTSVQFVLGGTIPHQEYKAELIAQMKGLSNIRLTGSLSWEESNSMFADASVFINTTMPDREGFPNTYIQAWLHETPVITLDCDPDDVMVRNGIGYRSGNIDRMCGDLQKLLDDEILRQAMGKKARSFAIEHHDIKKNAQLWDSFLTQLIQAEK